MPACEHCGEEFGNAGACASHENACDQRPSEGGSADTQQRQGSRQPQGPPQATGQGQGQAQPPARGQRGTPPAAQSADSVQLGAELGKSLSNLAADDPEKRAAAEGEALQTAGAAIAQMGQQIAEEKIARARNAKQTESDDLQVSDEFPRCPECGSQLKQIPPEQRKFNCPSCETQLEKTG